MRYACADELSRNVHSACASVATELKPHPYSVLVALSNLLHVRVISGQLFLHDLFQKRASRCLDHQFLFLASILTLLRFTGHFWILAVLTKI